MRQVGGFKTTLMIALTFLAALILTILPLPGVMAWFRPAWVLITLFFWLLVVPHRVGIITAWFMGLLVDLLTGGLLGLHALLFTLVAFSMLKFHHLVRGLSAFHNLLFVMLIQTLVLLIQHMIYTEQNMMSVGWYYWMPIISTPLFWVWGKVLLRTIQLRYKIG